jgi:hypothetical protein
MACCSQYLVSRNVPQRVDGCERTTGTVRGNKLVSTLRLTGDYAIDFVIDMNLFKKVLSDMVEQLVKVAVVVIDVASVWRVVVVFLQDGKGNLGVDAQRVDWHEAFVARLLLDDAELAVAKILR